MTEAAAAVKIGLFGAAGKMGCEIVAALGGSRTLKLVAAVGQPGSHQIGRDIGEIAGGRSLGVALGADVTAAARAADVLIDFSAPDGFTYALQACLDTGCALVSGTTGLGVAQRAALTSASARIALLHAPNMSLGMAILNRLAGDAAALLGDDFDVEIVEMHHRDKRDAPSGSALHLGDTIAAARGGALEQVAEFGRHGTQARRHGSIGFASLRGGAVAGDHSVVFAGEAERLELVHRAVSRRVFAVGALRAASWIAGRAAGRYAIEDVVAF